MDEKSPDTINSRIRLLRIELNMTREPFAKLIGIGVNTLKAIEDKQVVIGSDKVQKIVEIFPDLALWILTGQSGIKQLTLEQLVEKIALENALKLVADNGFKVTKN